MITAKEAKHQSLVKSELQEYLRVIEKQIISAINNGSTSARIDIHTPIRGELKNVLLKELDDLG